METFKWMRHFRERVTFTLVSIARFQPAILLNRRRRGGGGRLRNEESKRVHGIVWIANLISSMVQRWMAVIGLRENEGEDEEGRGDRGEESWKETKRLER